MVDRLVVYTGCLQLRSTATESGMPLGPEDAGGAHARRRGGVDAQAVVVYLSERGHLHGDHNQDIMFVDVDDGSEPGVFLQTPFQETHPVLSPNGRWLAYASDEAGVREIWVRAFPESEPAYRISTEGGTAPVWSHDGRRLFYKRQGAIWVVDVTAEAEFSRNTEPRFLLEGPFGDDSPIRSYDVAPDGRFVTTVSTDERAEDQPVTSLTIVLNWFEELKRLVPTER